MRPPPPLRRLAALPLLVVLSGCAHAGLAGAPPGEATPVQAAGAAGPTGPSGPSGPPAVVVTGSRLPQRVDVSTGLPGTTSPVIVYSAAELDRTGAPDTGRALQKLLP